LAVCALLVFAAGVVVYLLERDPNQVWLLPHAVTWPNGKGWMPALLRDSLPSFAHAFALSIATALVWARSRSQALACCGLWWLLDSVIEVAQHASLQRWAASHAFFYWPKGTFDVGDLVALALGAIAAAGVMWMSGFFTRGAVR
jgi:hypothetical protein